MYANSTELLKSLLEECNFFNKNDVTVVAMVTMTFQYGQFFRFNLILLEKRSVTPTFYLVKCF